MPTHDLRPTLAISGGPGLNAGEERFRLLESVAAHGSISAAAKAVGLSYKGAWDGINALNNLFPKPLVITRPGGKHGGGTVLTAEGERVLAAYRRLTEDLAKVLKGLEADLASPGAPSSSSLLWSLIMRTSARNTLHGVITEVKSGAVNAEITLKVSDLAELTVIVTNKSAVELGLHPGKDAYALIKASAPILMPEAETGRTSARNRICGAVLEVEPGAVNTEIVLDIGAGKTLTAIVTKESAESLAFKPGDRVCALVKASQILLGVD